MLLLCVAGLPEVNWQFRVDTNGVSLHRYFDLLDGDEQIAWSDIVSVRIFRSSRTMMGHYKLQFLSRDYRQITLSPAETLPAGFAVLLQKSLMERAPQSAGNADVADDLKYVRSISRLRAIYIVRNSRGQIIE